MGANDGLERFVATIPAPILFLDEHRRVVRTNRAVDALFSTSPAALIGRTIDELVAPGRRPEIAPWLASLSGAGPPAPWRTEVVDARQRPIPVEIAGSAWSAGAGRAFGLLVRDLREPGAPVTTGYSLPELLMANRLKDLV